MKIIACLFVIIGIFVAPLKGTAQESSDAGAADAGRAEDKAALAALPTSSRKLALGFTLDLLPTVLSATAGEFGMSGQIWVGIDHLRLRLVGAKISQPDWLAAKNGFRNRDTAVEALIFDYVFGDHFDKWWIGTGFELWQNSIEHKNADGLRAYWTNLVWTLGVGYIWRVVGNFYIEPWAAVHVVMNDPDVRLAEKTYNPFPVMGEVSLKIGWFLNL